MNRKTVPLTNEALNTFGWDFVVSYRLITGEGCPAILFNNLKAILQETLAKHSINEKTVWSELEST